jgi:hypothetical protein
LQSNLIKCLMTLPHCVAIFSTARGESRKFDGLFW